MIVGVITAFCALGTLLFGVYQYSQYSKVKRSETLSKLVFKLWSDEEIRSIIYLFEYDNNWYDNYHNTSKEVLIDKTLQYLSFICYQQKHGIIKEEEFEMFEYVIKRVFNNKSAIQYFSFLYSFSSNNLSNVEHVPFPFQNLLNYGLENGLIDSNKFSLKRIQN